MNDWLLFNAKLDIFQLCDGENKLILVILSTSGQDLVMQTCSFGKKETIITVMKFQRIPDVCLSNASTFLGISRGLLVYNYFR
jgi:hypothetical protein